MSRLSGIDWEAARVKWEADPTVSFADLGRQYGIAHTTLSRRAKNEGWRRVATDSAIRVRAQAQADALSVADAATSDDLPGAVHSETHRRTDERTDQLPKTASVDASIDLRAKLVQTHRAEWRKHASLFTLEAIAGDFDTGKRAKISAEMLGIRQKGERAAWGLDDDSNAKHQEREIVGFTVYAED